MNLQSANARKGLGASPDGDRAAGLRPQPPAASSQSSIPSAIPFTQFLLPHGRRRETSIEVAPEVADKARRIIARGFVFECEVLTTGQVSLTITDPEEGDLDIRVVPNGPGMREAVEGLVEGFPL